MNPKLVKLAAAILGHTEPGRDMTWPRALLLATAIFVALMGIAVGLWHISQRLTVAYLGLVLLTVLALNIAIPFLDRRWRRRDLG